MRVDLGQDVLAIDDKKVGTVDRLVINEQNKEVEQFVVHAGFFAPEDKLIDVSMVERVDDDGVRLNVDAGTVERLPTFVVDRFTEAPVRDLTGLPYAIPSGLGGGSLLYGGAAAGRGYPDAGSVFTPAPVDPPDVETRTNLPPQDIMIGKGTEVVGADGKKVGNVDEVLLDDRGGLQGFVVRAGILFRHDVRIPAHLIAEVGADQVRLTVTGDEAEQTGT